MEKTKRQGIVNQNKWDTSDLADNDFALNNPDQNVKTGNALVQTISIFGNGCYCDLLILANGKPSGCYLYDVYSPGQVNIGDSVSFFQLPDGTYQINSGGGNGTVTTVNASNTYVSVVYAGILGIGGT
jgi:hypothetical protein